jgi:hypothetical protein
MAGAESITVALFFALLSRPIAISESEEVRRAEQFIAGSGYTDLPADGSRLTPEPVVLSSSIEDELTQRHDTLERKADGANGHAGRCIAYFRRKDRRKPEPETRRAVVVGLKGDHIHIMHQDAY